MSGNYVLCANDHCCAGVSRSEANTHPWIYALKNGWRPVWPDSTDLICDDCAGPQNFCPHKEKQQ